MELQGAMNSEARKRREEAMGIPEPKYLTEVHPLYTGELEVDKPFRLCEPIIPDDVRLARIREELGYYGA